MNLRQNTWNTSPHAWHNAILIQYVFGQTNWSEAPSASERWMKFLDSRRTRRRIEMARGKQTCINTGKHLMSTFSIVRVNKKKKQTTTISGIRCKWCKKVEGRANKEIVNNDQ